MTIIIILLVVCCILLFMLLKRQNNIVIHNNDDVIKGMELERKKRKYRDYLASYYYDTIPPQYVIDGYRQIEKEVLGHYLNK